MDAVELARRRDNSAAWRAIRWLVVGSVAIVYASYAFVIEPPQAHAFYVLSPVAFMFAAYCWSFVDSPRARRVAAWLLGVNIAFHAGFAWAQVPEKSMYKNREPVAAAIRFKEPEMFAHRRPFAIGGGPLSLQDASRPYDPIQDIEISNASYQRGSAGIDRLDRDGEESQPARRLPRPAVLHDVSRRRRTTWWPSATK